jgi:hypothetical protein
VGGQLVDPLFKKGSLPGLGKSGLSGWLGIVTRRSCHTFCPGIGSQPEMSSEVQMFAPKFSG